MTSGLYEELTGRGLVVAHEEVGESSAGVAGAFKVIKPERIGFVSYPYEWCPGALHDAALLTLEIQRRALRRGMSLKDASAFNVQFRAGRPVFIDTLSFEAYRAGRPWVAYRQFCRHFLAPLALMSRLDVRLGALQTSEVDGIPLDLASRLLPWRSALQPGLFVHLHLHARMEAAHAPRTVAPSSGSFGKTALLGLVDSLDDTVRHLRWKPRRSEWSGYAEESGYPAAALEHKQRLVAEWLELVRPRTLWDLGANRGQFSRLAGARGIHTLALDADAACVEMLYQDTRQRGETHILPLRIDLRNPTAALGWRSAERMSLVERGPADAALALALVHHLALGANLPLAQIAELLAEIASDVAVEFVPKADPQAQRLMVVRDDVFDDYDQPPFERALEPHFHTVRREPIAQTERTLYFLRRRTGR